MTETLFLGKTIDEHTAYGGYFWIEDSKKNLIGRFHTQEEAETWG